MNKTRIYWIDYAKFIGIFLVALGHSAIPGYAVKFIYAFHMPLFFFISGYLFDYGKFTSFSAFASHRFKQLMVPYFFFHVITYLFWLFVGRKFGADAGAGIPPTTPLIGFAYGTDTGNYLVHCGPLWFLPCLFLVELMCFATYKLNKLLLFALFTLAGYANYRIHHVMLPWSFDVALIAMFFYLTGHLLRPHVNTAVTLPAPYKWVVYFVSLVLLIYLSQENGRADMSSNTYNNYFLFLLTALIGIIFTLSLAVLLQDLFGKISWMEFFAKNTLILLAFHAIAESIIKGLLYFGLKLPVETFKNTLWLNLLLTSAVFISLIPLIYLLNRYLPFFIGRKKARLADSRS